MPVFNQTEVENIFNLFDLKQEKEITRQKCREALKSMANTQKQLELAEDYVDIPKKVDLATFKKLWYAPLMQRRCPRRQIMPFEGVSRRNLLECTLLTN